MKTFEISLGNEDDGICVIIPGGLKWRGDTIPVTFNYDRNQIIGKASNIKVIDDHLEADIQWSEGKNMEAHLDSGWMDFVPEFYLIKYHKEGDTITVGEAMLTSFAVCIMPEKGDKDA